MFRKGYYHCIVLCAIIAIVAGLSYANFVANKLYEESRSHLTEIYTEVNQTFTTLATTNWNMLMDWNEYLAYGLDTLPQDRLDEYFEADKSRWGYTEVYFLKDTGEYMTLDGKHGQFPCQPQLETLQSEQQNIVLDVAEPDGNVLTLFAIPAAKNTYRGFSYSAVAAGYNNAAINEALNVTAFSGEAQCYMMDPNGRVILSTDKEKPPFVNFLTYLKHHSELSASEVEQMSANFEAKQSGIMQFHASGTAYYLLYQPVGFQDWMMVGAVPKSAVNTNIPQIQIVTIIALSAIFLASAIIGMAYLVRRSKQTLAAKNDELLFQEELFTILVQNSQDIFMLYSMETKALEYVSPNVEKLLGISTEFIGNDPKKFNVCAVNAEDSLLNRNLSRTPGNDPIHSNSEWANRKTGEHRWYHETLYQVTIRGYQKLLLVLSDRTSEWHNHQQLELALDIAKSANEAKSSFLSNMSHDIRTPMNAITGFTTLLEKSADDPGKVRVYTAKIMSASRHLLGLINDVLDMSKIESGNTVLHVTEFHLRELLDELRSMILPLTSTHRQSFSIQLQNIYCNKLWGDPLRISQILLNLLSNSVKYTPKGGNICLLVRMQEASSHGRIHLLFEVEDDGIGIEPDFLHTIFEPFTREEGKIQNDVQGTGLGMAITKNLVELMGGQISVKSTPNIGSRFSIDLELRAAEPYEPLPENAIKNECIECEMLEVEETETGEPGKAETEGDEKDRPEANAGRKNDLDGTDLNESADRKNDLGGNDQSRNTGNRHSLIGKAKAKLTLKKTDRSVTVESNDPRTKETLEEQSMEKRSSMKALLTDKLRWKKHRHETPAEEDSTVRKSTADADAATRDSADTGAMTRDTAKAGASSRNTAPPVMMPMINASMDTFDLDILMEEGSSKITGDRTSMETMARSQKETRQAPPEDEHLLDGIHLLVAEDNAFNAEILEDLLALRGATCEIVSTGRQAVNRFLQSTPGHFNAILMDIQMPDIDGYEATHMIRQSSHPEASSMTIIAITANAFAEDIQTALASGMNAHVPKPVDLDVLCRVLQNTM